MRPYHALMLAAALFPAGDAAAKDIDFGDDSGEYARDGECDDKRFEGPGMTTSVLLSEDIGADASDCRTAFEAGRIWLREVVSPDRPLVIDGILFGDDSGEYANDGECDDMRFEGPGMTTTLLLEADIGGDASDCAKAYRAGTLWPKETGGAAGKAGGRKPGE